MSCELNEKVSLLIDGELPASETRMVERHLATCAACQQTRADFLQLRQQISAYAVARDHYAERRVLAQVLAQRGGAHGAQSWRARLRGSLVIPRFSPLFAAVAALLVVACVVGLVMYRNANRRAAVANVNAPTNSKQREQASGKPAPETPTNSNPREEIAHKENIGRGTIDSEPTGKQQVAANNFASANQNRRPVPTGGMRLQSASNKLPRERRAPVRVPQPGMSAPDFVNANAAIATSVRVRPADAETLTARHIEQSELLLRTLRNARTAAAGRGAAGDLSYEKRRAQQLLYQNIVLRREAVAAGNVQVASLLDSLEPILLDIANMPADASAADLRAIRERVQRQNLVALLQVNSTALARAYD